MHSEESLTLMSIRAKKSTVDSLYAQDFIQREAHDLALEFLSPHQRWAFWIRHLSTLAGVIFILLGFGLLLMQKWHTFSGWHQLAIIESILFCLFMGQWTFTVMLQKHKWVYVMWIFLFIAPLWLYWH